MPAQAPLYRSRGLTGCRGEILSGPGRFYADTAHAHGGIARFRVFHKTIHTVADPEVAHEVLVTKRDLYRKTPRLYDNAAQVLGRGLITLRDDAVWGSDREVIRPGLHRRALSGLVDIVNRACDQAFPVWERSTDFVAAVQPLREIALQVISESMLGTTLERANGAQISENLMAASALLTRKNWSSLPLDERWPTPTNRRLRALRSQILDFMAEQVRIRLENGVGSAGDMLDLLLAAENPDAVPHLTRDRVLNELLTLFSAGYDTTSSSLAWTLYYLAKDPSAQEQLRTETAEILRGRQPAWDDVARLDATERAFNEAMRLRPPVHSIARTNSADDILGGYFIPANSTILISISGVNRSPAHWEHPDEFRPERFASSWDARAFIPFAAGPRRCLGALFSMVEGKLILARIAQRFSFETMPGVEVDAGVAAAQYPQNLFLRFATLKP